MGGGLRPSGSSFEDPFVYLLHSNVDRLWASWQLRTDYVGRNDTSFRFDPDYVYGQLLDGIVERPDFNPARDRYESQSDYDERRRAVGVESRREESGGCESRNPHLRTTALVRAVTASPSGGTAAPPSFFSTPGSAV